MFMIRKIFEIFVYIIKIVNFVVKKYIRVLFQSSNYMFFFLFVYIYIVLNSISIYGCRYVSYVLYICVHIIKIICLRFIRKDHVMVMRMENIREIDLSCSCYSLNY